MTILNQMLLQPASDPYQLLSRLPAVPVPPVPTPFQIAGRFSDRIGVETWIKRDDIGSYGVAGAKARKLQIAVAEAKATGARGLVTIGPPQSNTCRAVAAACAAAGLAAHLVIPCDEPERLSGNVLLAALMGATLHWCGTKMMSEYRSTLRQYEERLGSQGLRLLSIAPGCSNDSGVAGMVLGYLEMMRQAAEAGVRPTSVWHASATGGIWAGLELGAKIADGPRPHPVLVLDDLYPDMSAAYAEIYNSAGHSIGVNARLTGKEVDLDRSQLIHKYGEASSDTIDAIELLARSEGIICEPTYTGRALAALIASARRNELAGPIVFWHSGGLQVLGDPRIISLLNRMGLSDTAQNVGL